MVKQIIIRIKKNQVYIIYASIVILSIYFSQYIVKKLLLVIILNRLMFHIDDDQIMVEMSVKSGKILR